MKRFKTLRMRFALWVAVLMLTTLAGFGVFVYTSLAGSLSSAIDDSLRLSASQAIAAVNIEDGKINFTESIPGGFATTKLVERGITIRILDPQGKILQGFGPYQALQVDKTTLEAASVDHKSTFVTISDSGTDSLVRFFTTPILASKKLIGVVQVAEDLNSVQDTLNRLLAAFLLGVPFLIAIASLGGYFLVSRALSPIDAMTSTARRISAQDLSKRLNLPATDDEVGRLAQTFDEMLTRLDDSFRRERQFTADASHELRTPVAAMQAILTVIREKQRTPKDYEQALADLADEADRLQSLIGSLLAMARGETQQMLIREDVDLSVLLMDVADTMAPLAESKGLTLTCNIKNNLRLQGDSDGLIRLFVNLLDNAIQYTVQGKITMSANRAKDGSLQVIVVDTGIGITAEHIPQIFDRFYRASKSRSSRGAGLGLAIALEIAQAHGGNIQVESEAGKGSIFTVQLLDFPGTK